MGDFRRPEELKFSSGNLKESWKRWHQQFEIYLLASEKDSKSDKTKIAILLSLMGNEGIELLNRFKSEDPASCENYEDVIRMFEIYCLSRPNVLVERYNFFSCVQLEGQSIKNYVTRLKTLSYTCEFKDQRESLILDRIIIGIRDDGLKKRLLYESSLNVERAADIIRMSESTSTSSTNIYDCKRCGRRHVSRECPSYGKTSIKHKQKNHLAIDCPEQLEKVHELEQSEGNPCISKNFGHGEVHAIKDQNHSVSEETRIKNHSDSGHDSISILSTDNDSAVECTGSKVSVQKKGINPDGNHSSNKDQHEKDTAELISVKEEDDCNDEVTNNISSSHKKSLSNKIEKSSSKGILLSSSIGADSSDGGNELNLSSVKRKLFRKKDVKSVTPSKSMSMEELLKCSKLKESYVLLEKMDFSKLTENSSKLIKHESDEDLEELKKTVNSLSRLPKARKTTPFSKEARAESKIEKSTKQSTVRRKSEPKNSKMKDKDEKENHGTLSSSDIEFSSSDEEIDIKKTTTATFKNEDPNELAKRCLLEKPESSEESSSNSSSSDIVAVPKSKKKVARKNANSSSDGKTKYEKLLHVPLNASDDDDGEKNKKDKVDNEETKDVEKKKGKKRKILSDDGKSSDSRTDNSSSSYEKTKKKRKKRIFLSDDAKSTDSLSENSSSSDKKTKKKRKKKKISTDDEKSTDSISENSSGSENSFSSDENEKKPKLKKRRRIKSVSESADEGSGGRKDSDNDLESILSQDIPSVKGRKNIRKVLSTEKLADETKEAQMAEEKRRQRLQEKQKLYYEITETPEDGTPIITRKMVLEVDPDSKEEVVEIHPDFVEKLKPHQINGVKFMWECTIESLKELETKPGSGCILAHCMGLGKTLQVIAFLYTCMTNKLVSKHIKTAMIICPYNTVLNWEKEFETWLEGVEHDIPIHLMPGANNDSKRLSALKKWEVGGVLIIGSDVFRRLVEYKIETMNTEKIFRILTETPDIVVCDEGHILKNETTSISKATSKLKTQRRIALTGTPLQNNLKECHVAAIIVTDILRHIYTILLETSKLPEVESDEAVEKINERENAIIVLCYNMRLYHNKMKQITVDHCMVQFVKPGLLGMLKEFSNRFINPIINGQYYNSYPHDVQLMKERAHILHKLLEGCVQRCDYSILTKYLPPKYEFVISVRLSEVQIKMYQYYLDKMSKAKLQGKIDGRTLFADYNALKSIWTFPFICHLRHERIKKKQDKQLVSGEKDGLIDNSNGSNSDLSKSAPGSPQPSTSKNNDNLSREDEVVHEPECATKEGSEDKEEEIIGVENDWYYEFISDEDRYNINLSGKMVLLLDILKECEAIGDKIIVFSLSILTLNMIEDVLAYMDEKPLTEEDKGSDMIGTWERGIDYFRMDGTTTADLRKKWTEQFNNPNNERARLFLISTKAGSLGINLIGANRVVLLDASWNPFHDVQAIFRVYRFGQTKPVYIYRLLAQGTMEEKIYDRQVTKLSLSIRVMDEKQIDRHFNEAQLAELYNFKPDSKTDRPTMVPKDRLLAEMHERNKHWIVNYHEHVSLLQNSSEEDLTEEERRSAWNEFEKQKSLLNIPDAYPIYQEIYERFNVEPYQALVEKVTLPSVDDAITLIQKIITQCHNADSNKSQRLLDDLRSLWRMYKSRHAKFLEIKKENFSKSIILSGMSKYLDDLVKIVKSLSSHINKLRVRTETKKTPAFQQASQQAQARMAAPQNTMPNTYTQNQNSMPVNPQYYPEQATQARMTVPQNIVPKIYILNQNSMPINLQYYPERGVGHHALYPQNVYRATPSNAELFPSYAPMASGSGASMYASNNQPTSESPMASGSGTSIYASTNRPTAESLMASGSGASMYASNNRPTAESPIASCSGTSIHASNYWPTAESHLFISEDYTSD